MVLIVPLAYTNRPPISKPRRYSVLPSYYLKYGSDMIKRNIYYRGTDITPAPMSRVVKGNYIQSVQDQSNKKVTFNENVKVVELSNNQESHIMADNKTASNAQPNVQAANNSAPNFISGKTASNSAPQKKTFAQVARNSEVQVASNSTPQEVKFSFVAAIKRRGRTSARTKAEAEISPVKETEESAQKATPNFEPENAHVKETAVKAAPNFMVATVPINKISYAAVMANAVNATNNNKEATAAAVANAVNANLGEGTPVVPAGIPKGKRTSDSSYELQATNPSVATPVLVNEASEDVEVAKVEEPTSIAHKQQHKTAPTSISSNITPNYAAAVRAKAKSATTAVATPSSDVTTPQRSPRKAPQQAAINYAAAVCAKTTTVATTSSNVTTSKVGTPTSTCGAMTPNENRIVATVDELLSSNTAAIVTKNKTQSGVPLDCNTAASSLQKIIISGEQYTDSTADQQASMQQASTPVVKSYMNNLASLFNRTPQEEPEKDIAEAIASLAKSYAVAVTGTITNTDDTTTSITTDGKQAEGTSVSAKQTTTNCQQVSYKPSNQNTKFLCEATNDIIATTIVHGFIQPHDFAYSSNCESVNVSNHHLQAECSQVSPSNHQCINTARELILSALTDITQEEYNVLKFTEVTNLAGLKGILPRGYTFNATQHVNNFTIAIWKHNELPITHVAVLNTDSISTVVYETKDNEVDLSEFLEPHLFELVKIKTESKEKVISIKYEEIERNNLFHTPTDLPRDYIQTPTFGTKANIKIKPKSKTLNLKTKYQQLKEELNDLAMTMPFDPQEYQKTPIYSQLNDDYRYFNGEFVVSGVGNQHLTTVTDITENEEVRELEMAIKTASSKLEVRRLKHYTKVPRKVENTICKGTNIWSPLKVTETVRLGKMCNKNHNFDCKKEIEKKLCEMCRNHWYVQRTGGVFDTEIGQTLVHTQLCVACAIEFTDYECDCEKENIEVCAFKREELSQSQVNEFKKNKKIQFRKGKQNQRRRNERQDFEEIQESKDLPQQFFHHNHFALRGAKKVVRLSKYSFVKNIQKFGICQLLVYHQYNHQIAKSSSSNKINNKSSSSSSSSNKKIIKTLKNQLQQQEEVNKRLMQQQEEMNRNMESMRMQMQEQMQQQQKMQMMYIQQMQQLLQQQNMQQMQQQNQQQSQQSQQLQQQQQQQQEQQAQSQPQKLKQQEQQAQSQPQKPKQQEQQAQSQPQQQQQQQKQQQHVQSQQHQQQQQQNQSSKKARPKDSSSRSSSSISSNSNKTKSKAARRPGPKTAAAEAAAASASAATATKQQQQYQQQQLQHQNEQPKQMSHEEATDYISDLVQSPWFTTATKEMARHYSKNAICRHNLYGKCRFGSKCKMAHISFNGRYGPIPNQQQQEQLKATMLLPCRNYLQGCCNFGEKCNNLHSYINIERVNKELQKGNLFLLHVPIGFKTKYVIVSEQQMRLENQLRQLQAVNEVKTSQEQQQGQEQKQQEPKQEQQQQQKQEQQKQQQQRQQVIQQEARQGNQKESQQQQQRQQENQKESHQQQQRQQENQKESQQQQQRQQENQKESHQQQQRLQENQQENQQQQQRQLVIQQGAQQGNQQESQQEQKQQQSLQQSAQETQDEQKQKQNQEDHIKIQSNKNFKAKIKQQQDEIQRKKDQKKQERRQQREKFYEQQDKQEEQEQGSNERQQKEEQEQKQEQEQEQQQQQSSNVSIQSDASAQQQQKQQKEEQEQKQEQEQEQQQQQSSNVSIQSDSSAQQQQKPKQQRQRYQVQVIKLTTGTPLNLTKPDNDCQTCQDATKYLARQGLRRVVTVFDKSGKQLNKFAIVVAFKGHYGIFESGNPRELFNGEVHNEILTSSVEACFIPSPKAKESLQQQQQQQQQQPQPSQESQQQQRSQESQQQQQSNESQQQQQSQEHQQQPKQQQESQQQHRESKFELITVKDMLSPPTDTSYTSTSDTSIDAVDNNAIKDNVNQQLRYRKFVSEFRDIQKNSKYLPPRYKDKLVQYKEHKFDILYASKFVEMEPNQTKRYHNKNFVFCKEEAGVMYGYYHSDRSDDAYEGVDFPCFIQREVLLAEDCYVSKKSEYIYHKNDIFTSSVNLPLQYEIETFIWPVSKCRAEGIKIDKKTPFNTKVIVCYRYCQLVEGKNNFQRHVRDLLDQHSNQACDDVTVVTDPLRIARAQVSLLLKLLDNHLRHGLQMSINNYLNCQSTEFSLSFNNFDFKITKFALAHYQLCENGNEVEPDLHGIFIDQLCKQVNFKYTMPETLTPSNYGKVILNIIKQNVVCVETKIPYEFEMPDSLDVKPQVDDIDYGKLIGRGAYGRVFGSKSGKFVFKLQGLQSSQYEFKILNKVQHLNVPKVVAHYEFDEEEVGIIKMEALELKTLDLLKVEEKIDLRTRQDMLMQCLEHLEDVLKCGIVQNDYHMANMAWTEKSELIILDWGLAKQRKEGQEQEFNVIVYGWYVNLIIDVLANIFLDYYDEVYYVVKQKDLLCYFEWFMDEELFTKTHQIFGNEHHEMLHHPPIQEDEEADESEWESEYSEDQSQSESQKEKPQEKIQEVKIQQVEPQEKPQEVEPQEKLQEKVETQKLETQKVETQKLETRKVETQKLETQKVETQKLETQKVEPQKLETQKVETQKLETQKVETQKLETQKVEIQKLKTQKVENQKLETQEVKFQQEEEQQLQQEAKPPQEKPREKPQELKPQEQQEAKPPQERPQEKPQELKPQEQQEAKPPQERPQEKPQELKPQEQQEAKPFQERPQEKPQELKLQEQQLQQEAKPSQEKPQEKPQELKPQEQPQQEQKTQKREQSCNYTNNTSLLTLTQHKINCVNTEINNIQQQLTRLKKGKAKAQKAVLKAKLEKLNAKKVEYEKQLNCKPKISKQKDEQAQQSAVNQQIDNKAQQPEANHQNQHGQRQYEQGKQHGKQQEQLQQPGKQQDQRQQQIKQQKQSQQQESVSPASSLDVIPNVNAAITKQERKAIDWFEMTTSPSTTATSELTNVTSAQSDLTSRISTQAPAKEQPQHLPSTNIQAPTQPSNQGVEHKLNEIKKMLASLQQVNTNLLNEDQVFCHNEALRACLEQIQKLAAEVNGQSTSSSETSESIQPEQFSRDIQATSRQPRPKVDRCREVSDVTIRTSTTATSCKPGVNRCFIYAAEAALMTLGKYFTQDTLNDLYKLADRGQHDASEVVTRSGIPTIQTGKCILHGTCELMTPCCSNVVPNTTATHMLIKEHLSDISNYGLVVLEPLAYLHYSGNALNGHWKCSYNTAQGAKKMKDSGVTSNINKHPKATWTLCKIMLNTNLGLSNGDISSNHDIVIISQNINLVASLLTAHGDPVHHDATTLAIVRSKDAITVTTPEAVDYKALKPSSIVYCFEYDPIVSKKLKATKCKVIEPQAPSSSFELDNKNKASNIKAMQRNLRQQLTSYYSTNLTTQGPIKTLVVGIGKGNDIPHYAAANCGKGFVYDGCDINEEALNICATKVPSTTSLYQSDVNTSQFDKLCKKYDLLVSTFSWHFKNEVKCGKHHEFHVIPVYNPDTYDTWSKYYEVTVHSKDKTSVTHTINMPTCRTTETLHTIKWWYEQYCSNVTIKSLQTELNSSNKHFSNFIVLIHTGHKTPKTSFKTVTTRSTPVSRGSSASSPSSTSRTANSMIRNSDSTATTSSTRNTSATTASSSQERSNQKVKIPQLPADNHDCNTMQSEDADDEKTEYEKCLERSNIPITIHSCNSDDFVDTAYATRPENVNAFFCREFCTGCFVHLPKNAVVDRQLLTNAQVYLKWSGISLNELSYDLISSLHQREVICLDHLEPAPAVTDDNWVIRRTTTKPVKVLYMSHDVFKTVDSTQAAILHRDFDIFTHQLSRFTKKPVQSVVIHTSSKDEAESICNALENYNISNIKIAEHRVGQFETLAFNRKTCQYESLTFNKERAGIWEQIKNHCYDIKKPYLIEWNNITEECSHDDKYKAIASFSDKHGLDSYQRLIGADKCVFVDYKTHTDTNPDKLDDYYRSRHATETGKEVVYTAVFKIPPTDSTESRTVFAALAVTKDGKSLYINGDKTSIPATATNKALYHIMQAKYGNNTKIIGEVYSKFYSSEKEIVAAFSYKDLFTILPFFLFFLQPGFFTFALSLMLTAYFLLDRKALCNFATSTHQLISTVLEYETAAAMSYLRFSNYRVIKYTLATANAVVGLYLLFHTYWSCVSNHDLIDTTQPPYHSRAQRLLAFLDYIPSVHEYANAVTLKELCGSNIICRLGSPYNKLYLDQYTHYVTSKGHIFRDKILSVFSFYTPWGLLMYCLDFKPSIHLACYNILMTVFIGYFIVRRFFVCCKASGPFCAKHAMLRTNNIQYYCSGKPHNIQAMKVKYCTKHKWWCNTSQEHLLPHPIARVIEASTQMQSNFIKSDNYFTYVSQPADRDLPDNFKDYSVNHVYSTKNLSYLEWTQRAALFAYCSSTKVKISSHDSGSITNQKVEMTQQMLDYFRTNEDWKYNYVAAQQAGRRNILHVGFLESMSEKELSEFYEFCCQYDQSYTKTCIKRDNFLNGKVPDCFKSSRLLSTKYHTDTIYLDSFAVEHHDDIKQQASQHHFLVSQGKPKKYINSKRNIFIALAVLFIVALTRVAYRKVVKINTPAGLNPTGKDYAKGTLYLHESLIATPVAYGNNRRVQAWHFNNGTFAFTEKRSTLTARTSCGAFENSFFQVETYHQSCDQYWPLAINFFKLSIYWFQADKPYTTRHGDYQSQEGAICFGLSDSLVCHETMSIYSPSAFIWITSSVVLCFVFSIFLYIKMRGYFGNYTSSVLVLMTVHAITVVLYLFVPGLAFVFVIALFFFPAYRLVISTYSFVVCAMFFGLNLVLLFGLYLIIFLFVFWFTRNQTNDVEYTPSGVVFSSNFSGIAKNAFLLTPEVIPTILSVTGKNYAQLLEMSTGPQLKPETALANAILKCSITNTKMLYEPPKSTRLPAYLQSKLNRLSDIVINQAQLTNICGIHDGTGVIGHGIFTTPTTVLTARHCYTPAVQVFYRGILLQVKDHNDTGFNTILTVDKQEDVKPLAIDNHHELELGTQYTHVVSPLDDQATVTVHQLNPTPSGHFAHAATIAGESGSPIFYHNKLIGIHQAMVKSKEHTGAHAIACRVDGTPFDSSFHDTLMAAGKVEFDGNALFNHYLNNECRKAISVREFNNQITQVNHLISKYSHISIINDHALMQSEPKDLTPLMDFLKDSPVIQEHHCKPYKLSTDIKLQTKISQRIIVHCTLSNMLSFCMTLTYFITTAVYGNLTIKNFIDLLLAGFMLTVVFRSRHVVFLLTTGAYFVNMLELFMHVCHMNVEVIKNIFSGNDDVYAHVLQTVVRFGIQDALLCTVILFVMMLKFVLLPLRCAIFTIVYWTLVYLVGGVNVHTIAVFIFSFANTSSWFTCLTLFLQNTVYFPVWFTLNIVLSMRISFPKWVINRYHQITSDSVRVNRAYFCHHLATYQRPPSFFEVLISQMFYSQDDVIEYIPQSKIVPYSVVGSATHYPNVNAKSLALMSGSDSNTLYAHFISAVEAVLQSTTAADQQAFMEWCAATCDCETLEKWLQDNPEDLQNKLRTKRRNIIQARIMFLKAKEEKLRKQINLMQLEQVRGMMRSELSIRLCDTLQRSVAEMQEKANLRTKTFGKGIIAASTLTVPEVLVITNTNGRDKISWDDESECFCFEFEEAIYHIKELNTNVGQAINTEAELNALTATNFPLYGKLYDFTFDGVKNQANIGFTIKPHQIKIIRASSGIKVEYASSADKATKPILEEVQEATDNTVLLVADGVLKPFKVNSNVPAPVLAAVMTKLRFDSPELQAIKLGGLENVTEHVATSNQPLRCRGYVTYFAPSLCRYCRTNIEHKCKYQQFVQIPANEDPDKYLSTHDICQHNKFSCNTCHGNVTNQVRKVNTTIVKPADRLRELRAQAKNSSRPQ
uniref:histone acetyltransferase n=1 Tax=Python nidovirus TaxID=1526652 RepID=A0A076E579_9NIDO|nr:pp1a [Python nidovirus]